MSDDAAAKKTTDKGGGEMEGLPPGIQNNLDAGHLTPVENYLAAKGGRDDGTGKGFGFE